MSIYPRCFLAMVSGLGSTPWRTASHNSRFLKAVQVVPTHQRWHDASMPPRFPSNSYLPATGLPLRRALA